MLILDLLEAPQLDDAQPSELATPRVEGLLANSQLAAQLDSGCTGLSLSQRLDALLSVHLDFSSTSVSCVVLDQSLGNTSNLTDTIPS